MTYSDEILSAYLDGEIESEEAEKIDAALALDVAFQARLRELTRADNAVRNAYGPIADEPVPERIVDLVKRGARGNSSGDNNVAAFSRMAFATPRPVWAQAMAASLILIVGVLIGQFVLDPPVGEESATRIQLAGTITSGEELYETLEYAPSAVRQVVDERSGALAEPLLTFVSTDGRLCREFIVASPGAAVHAVACKAGEPWQVVMALESASGFADASQYRTAAAATDESVGGFLEKFMAGDAFSGDDEKALIKSGWKAAK